MGRVPWRRLVVGLALAKAGAVAAYLLAHPWLRRWGATEDEALAPMPGDALVPAPNFLTTRAITIHAPPEDVWPWLVQMGEGRGGLYSYDWLDRLFGLLSHPSREEVLPAFQSLKAGDEIPLGRAGEGLPVHAVEPLRSLVLAGDTPSGLALWSIELRPVDAHTTRLLSRTRWSSRGSLPMRLAHLWMDPAEFLMVRKWLLTLRHHAEALTLRRAEALPHRAPAPRPRGAPAAG